MAEHPALPVSRRARALADSVIMDVLDRNERLHGAYAVNLAAGIPEWEPHPSLVEAGVAALRDGHHQYAHPAGAQALRADVARVVGARWGRAVDGDREVTITAGATTGLAAALLALADPGDEVIVFEPCHEGHLAACVLAGVRPRRVRLREPSWSWTGTDLERAVSVRTRAVLVNTPHNPTGKVFTRAELEAVAGVCASRGIALVSDEIYEAFVYEGAHVSPAALTAAAGRAIVVSGASKAFAVTGWRTGWVVAPPPLTAQVRKVHDHLTAGGPHPLQVACRAALALPDAYGDRLRTELRARRRYLVDGLRELGLRAEPPAGAYYVFADISPLGFESDAAFVEHCLARAGVALVPGSAFYAGGGGQQRVRASFAASRETISRGLDALRGALS